MICQELTIYSQNVKKNKILTDIILETRKANTNIIFIQEPLRYLIQCFLSYTNTEGNPPYRAPHYPE